MMILIDTLYLARELLIAIRPLLAAWVVGYAILWVYDHLEIMEDYETRDIIQTRVRITEESEREATEEMPKNIQTPLLT